VNVIAINGSPRKDWNTATMLRSALEGATSSGAQTKLVHLYDLTYQACTSCFSCKRKGNTCGGLCAMRDDLREVLGEVLESDALILGSPIYFGDVTGGMRSFLERLLFPNITYDQFGVSVFPKEMHSGWIFTMNCPEKYVEANHYDWLFQFHADLMKILKGTCEVVTTHETYQFSDYSAMNAAMFDVDAKTKRRAEQFPLDRRKAFDMGVRLAKSR
jgi:multimeric flavodoxin WrbA